MNLRLAAVVVAVLAAGAAGCGRQEPPKVDAEKERKEALERSKQGALSTQVQAVEAAKGMGEDLDRKAREAVEKAEQGTK